MDFIKDDKEACGWKRLTYEDGASQGGVGTLTAEIMDEGMMQEEEIDGDM